jgi:hypothetical protein
MIEARAEGGQQATMPSRPSEPGGASRRYGERRAGTHNHRQLLQRRKAYDRLPQQLRPVVMGPRFRGDDSQGWGADAQTDAELAKLISPDLLPVQGSQHPLMHLMLLQKVVRGALQR